MAPPRSAAAEAARGEHHARERVDGGAVVGRVLLVELARAVEQVVAGGVVAGGGGRGGGAGQGGGMLAAGGGGAVERADRPARVGAQRGPRARGDRAVGA